MHPSFRTLTVLSLASMSACTNRAIEVLTSVDAGASADALEGNEGGVAGDGEIVDMGNRAHGDADATQGRDRIAEDDGQIADAGNPIPAGDATTAEDAEDTGAAQEDADVHPDALPSDVYVWDGGRLCRTLNDCHYTQPATINYCAGSAWSCIDTNCVWECEGPDTCVTVTHVVSATSGPQQCLDCGAGPECRSDGCGLAARPARIDLATWCPVLAGAPMPLEGSMWTLQQIGNDCHFELLDQGGNEWAEYSDYLWLNGHPIGPNPLSFGFFPPLGGTCTGIHADSALRARIVFSCPACQFVLGYAP